MTARNSYLHAAINQEPKPKAEAKNATAEPVLNDGLDGDTGDFTPADETPSSEAQGAPSEEPNPTLAQPRSEKPPPARGRGS